MDRAAIEELFAYTEWTWDCHGSQIATLSDEQFQAAIPGSGWPSISAVPTHVVLAYDGWLHGGWALRVGERVRPEGYQPQSWQDLQRFRQETRAAFRSLLDTLSDSELARPIDLDFGDGPSRMSKAQILTNLLIHERGHHGDLNTLLYQLGLRVPIVDYGRFIRFPDAIAYEDEA